MRVLAKIDTRVTGNLIVLLELKYMRIRFTAVLGVYLLVGVSGYIVLGDAMQPNIVEALKAGWISYVVNILITIHLMMAAVIVTNPVTQGIEGFFGIPDSKIC